MRRRIHAALDWIFCRASYREQNVLRNCRSLTNVILGGYASKASTGLAPPGARALLRRAISPCTDSSMQAAPKSTSGGASEAKVHQEIDVPGTLDVLLQAKKVVIVPGYGLAVANAQHSVAELAKILWARGADVKFGIHPVAGRTCNPPPPTLAPPSGRPPNPTTAFAGRMPGQLNVLLAEAGVPYDWVEEADQVNGDMADVDVCLVVGGAGLCTCSLVLTAGLSGVCFPFACSQ